MKKHLVLFLLPIWSVVSVSQAAEREKPHDEELEKLLYLKKWEEASDQLSKMEKAGLCDGATCLAARALILNGKGKTVEAQETARHAVEAFSEGRALTAWLYNELGALLYRGAAGKRESLQLAESAFRRAAARYEGQASNIRFNLAVVLDRLGKRDDAKKIMGELEAEGILVDGGMAILGEFKTPDRQ